MLVAVSSEPKLTFPSTVSRPDNVSKVEAASSFTSLGPTAAAGRTGRRGDRVTLPNVEGRGPAARRAEKRTVQRECLPRQAAQARRLRHPEC